MEDDEAGIESHYIDAFEANLGHTPQQTQARLVQLVDSDLNFTKPGDMINGDDIGTSEPTEIEDRFGYTPDGTIAKKRRVGFFTPYEDAKWLDDIDTAKSLSDPANAVMVAMTNGHNRYRDRKIIEALGAPAREGRTGETTVAYKAAQSIAVNDWSYKRKGDASTGDAPMTFAKINHTKVKLDKGQLEGKRTMVVSSEQLGQLLTDPVLTDRESASVQALINGEIGYFMGFHWVITELLPLVSGVRTCFGFVGSAIKYRGRKLTEAQIWRRKDRKNNWQAYYKGTHAALRRYDEGVVRVYCAEP